MSYNYRVLNDNPLHFYSLEGGSFADLTGRANATALGTPTQSAPLVVGGGNSIFVDGNNHFRFATTVFHLESPYQPFTLEAWFKPLSITGPKGVIGHDGQDDGIYFDGERIVFATDHGAAGRAEAIWYPPQTDKAMHAIGVHTDSRNELFVNGVRVASVTLTDEQLLAGYNVTTNPGSLFVGHRPGSLIIDSVAVYAHALTSRQAKLHFLWGRDVPDFRDVVIRRNGTYWDFSDETADVAYDMKFSTTDEWSRGLSASVIVEDDTISPTFDAGTSVESTWMNGFILSSVAGTFDGSKIWWDGDGGFTVSVSLNDGTTWTTATNGREVPGISESFVTGNQSLQVRVVFPAGLSETSVNRLRSLNLRFYNDRDVYSNSSRLTEFSGNVVLSQQASQPIEQNNSSGAHFYNGHGVVEAGDAVRTLEFWVYVDELTATPSYLFDAREGAPAWLYWTGTAWSGSTSTTYLVNGVSRTANSLGVVAGQWNHIIVILPADTSSPIYLATRYSLAEKMKARFGFFATYPTALSVPEATALYNSHMGIPGATVNEATGLSMADDADPVRAYAYSWSTVGSG